MYVVLYRVCVCVLFTLLLMLMCYRQLCLDLVPRREFSMVDPEEISVTELYRLVSGLLTLTNTSFREQGGEMQLSL